MRTTFAGYVIFFLVIAVSLGINLGMHILETLDMGRNYLLLTIIAVAMAGLLVNRKLFFLLLVAILSIAINLPEEQLREWYIDRITLLATLLALIVLPVLNKRLGLESDSR
jgi:hypothetical protein